jgi:hypothetical protein
MWAPRLLVITSALEPATGHNPWYTSSKLVCCGGHRRAWVMRFNQWGTCKKELERYQNVRRQQNMSYNWGTLIQSHVSMLVRECLGSVMGLLCVVCLPLCKGTTTNLQKTLWFCGWLRTMVISQNRLCENINHES